MLKNDLKIPTIKSKMMTIKPLLKWVGGKRELVPELLKRFPSVMDAYHEPFVGGGSVLLALLHARNEGRVFVRSGVFAYDANETLIHFYRNVQRDPTAMFEATQQWEEPYKSLVNLKTNNSNNETKKSKRFHFEGDEVVCSDSKEMYYYWARHRYNRMTQEERNGIQGSALFLFLNKTCFRGLYRMGPNGFNVPFGHYKNVTTDYDHMMAFSKTIQDVTFRCADFRDVLTNHICGTHANVFVYLDPPYVPLEQLGPETGPSKSFVQYTADGFSTDDHKDLFALLLRRDSPVRYLMSNSDTPFVRQWFSSASHVCIHPLPNCKRSIHSKRPQSVANELLIEL